MTYKTMWEENGVYWKYSGKVSGDEIVEASTSLYGDPRFSTMKYKFVDFYDVERIEIDDDQLALIAYQHLATERANPYLKNAILAKSNANLRLAYEFASYFDKSSWSVKVFTDPDEANNWVGR
jgi:hypothetical protein